MSGFISSASSRLVRIIGKTGIMAATQGRKRKSGQMNTPQWRIFRARAIAKKKATVRPAFEEWRSLSPEEENVLSPQQKHIFNVVRDGHSVFFTGNAGTGKSFLLKHIVKCAPQNSTFVTALTGIAAVQIGGTTLHSFAGIGLGVGSPDKLVFRASRGNSRENWDSVKVLIIDEISMLEAELFDKLNFIAQKLKKNQFPFGGIQLVLVGDFFQLPPVVEYGKKMRYCFQSKNWKTCIEHTLELTHVFRQSDPELIQLLNEVRYNLVSEKSLELLTQLSRSITSGNIEPTKLFSHNADVARMNNSFLANLPGPEYRYFGQDSGSSPYVENLNKYVRACDVMVLKQGAQVMLIKNMSKQLVNGSRGVVVGFDGIWPLVEFRNIGVVKVGVEEFLLQDRLGNTLASRKQVPLKLAWAITIHKSQGMSIDLLQVHLKQVFTQGQAYVALSRARTLEGLQVLSFDDKKFWTNPDVVNFHKEHIKPACDSWSTSSHPPEDSEVIVIGDSPQKKCTSTSDSFSSSSVSDSFSSSSTSDSFGSTSIIDLCSPTSN